MTKITLALVVLALATLACTLTPQMEPTAGEASEPFPTQPIPSPIVTIPITATAAPITCRVSAAEALHVRDAPNVQGTVTAWLFAGDQLTLSPTPPAGVWVEVTTAQGVPGWVNSKYIDCEVTE